MPVRPAVPDGPLTLTLKTRLCNKYNTEDGWKWGDKCHFAHGEGELGKHIFVNKSRPPHVEPMPTSHFAPPAILNAGMATPPSFEASATVKISVDASLVSAIIGKCGINTKYISRVTGVKLALRDHESDASFKNIELEVTFDQINDASALVTELIVSIGGNMDAPSPGKNLVGGSHCGGGQGSNFKTKLCEHFNKEPCTFGDMCNFAHGENELHKSAAITAGCPFSEGCHFLHCFPGDQAVAHPPGRMPVGSAVPDGPLTLTLKTHLCNKYNTEDGCKWGDKCHFAHGEGGLGKHMFVNKSRLPHVEPRPTSHFAPPTILNPGMTTPASFEASATAKISVDASLVGAIIGRGGINTKYISQVTRVKLAIRDHESDASLRNIELEGTFDQINDASALVTELIVSIGGNSDAPPPGKYLVGGSHCGGGPGSNFKTKLCEHFNKGSCAFGDRCFAHGENELCKSAAT